MANMVCAAALNCLQKLLIRREYLIPHVRIVGDADLQNMKVFVCISFHPLEITTSVLLLTLDLSYIICCVNAVCRNYLIG